MATRVDPNLLHELKAYGAVGIEKCFNCGNCTAICPLTSDDHPFPRNMIRMTQIGLKDELSHSLDPWLCYYCGECSETCPKGAEPGETMMAVRRWLTAQYDWTGLSGKVYKGAGWIITMLLVGAILVIGLATLLHGPLITSQVELNTFAPVEMIHIADLILAAVLGFFLLSNLARMYFFVFSKEERQGIPLKVYLTEVWQLVFHTLTQNRFSECGDSKRRWINHLVIVAGYGTMFALIVVFLGWFQTDNIYPIYHPQRWLGYLAAGALIYGGVEAVFGRIRKQHEMHKYSHPSDWLFPILLVLLAASGLVIHFLRYAGLPLATYYAYVAHLVIMMMLYVTVGPMGKWAHLLYRPFAVYFQAVKIKAKEVQEELSVVPAAADLRNKTKLRRLILEEETIEKIVVVLNHDDSQSVMAALVMSAAVASTGDQVLLFIQPGGAKIVAKGGLEPYQGLKGQPDPIELFDAIQILDGRVILCELGLPIWDMEREDLVDDVEVMMASTFLFEAEGAKMSFSY